MKMNSYYINALLEDASYVSILDSTIPSDRVVDELRSAVIFPKYNSLGITPDTTPRIDHPDTLD